MNKFESIEISSLSRIFSTVVIKDLAKHGRSSILAELIFESNIMDYSKSTNLAGLFDDAFQYLKSESNRHEYIYKAAITEKVLLGIHSLNTASMMTEFRVGKCKADVVILNGTGTVYEIKSERDKLSRLVDQVDAYMDVFASVNVIIGENHYERVRELVPADVGIMLLSERYNIRTARVAKNLPSRTKPVSIFDSIRISEAELILNFMGVGFHEVPNTKKYEYYRELFRGLDSEETHFYMVKVLKMSRSLKSLQGLVNSLPKSLHSVALTSKVRMQDHLTLVNAMNTPTSELSMWS